MALGTTANEADQSAFQSNSSGILSKGCGTSLDHGVLASNYDPDAGYGQNQPRASLGKSYSAATFGRVYDGDEVAINAYSINFTVGEETYKPGMNQVIIPTWW